MEKGYYDVVVCKILDRVMAPTRYLERKNHLRNLEKDVIFSIVSRRKVNGWEPDESNFTGYAFLCSYVR